MEEENKARRSSALLNVTDSAAESGQPVVAVIKRSNAAEDTILIPLLSDQSSITLATLQSHFPDAIGLKYKVREEWYAVTLDALGTSFLNPIGGWAAKTFEIRTMESKTSPGSERSNLPEWNEGVVEYLLETEDGCCVTVIAKRGAVTCYRCLDDQIAVDDLINVKLCRGNPLTKFPNGQQSAVLKVAYIDRITDLVFMVAAIDLCHKPPVPGYARYGLPYVILGLSGLERQFQKTVGLKTTFFDGPLVIKKGIVSSKLLDEYNRHLGDAGMNPGDSGGGLYDLNGEFLGIAVSSDIEADKGISLCHFIPSSYFIPRIQVWIQHGKAEFFCCPRLSRKKNDLTLHGHQIVKQFFMWNMEMLIHHLFRQCLV